MVGTSCQLSRSASHPLVVKGFRVLDVSCSFFHSLLVLNDVFFSRRIPGNFCLFCPIFYRDDGCYGGGRERADVSHTPGVRRSQRHSVFPVKFWKGDNIRYQADEDGLLEAKGLVKGPSTTPAPASRYVPKRRVSFPSSPVTLVVSLANR